jgi:hypothetical protein
MKGAKKHRAAEAARCFPEGKEVVLRVYVTTSSVTEVPSRSISPGEFTIESAKGGTPSRVDRPANYINTSISLICPESPIILDCLPNSGIRHGRRITVPGVHGLS